MEKERIDWQGKEKKKKFTVNGDNWARYGGAGGGRALPAVISAMHSVCLD